MDESKSPERKYIIVEQNGPYHVKGGIPLVAKIQVVSEHGEPLAWRKEGVIQAAGDYKLCRCGHSSTMPFCDDTHFEIEFDGTETAETGPTAERQRAFGRATRIVVKKDSTLCMEAGFCGMVNANMPSLVAATNDTKVRSLVIAMVERCPSGSLTYRVESADTDNEPDLPQQIVVTTEITDEGPIAGPLWITGGIPIERADGQPFETRNRVTLCNCGASSHKPLCDGTHREMAEQLGRRRAPKSR
ncbi:MAG: CDGSH iron-sulfur domain-containing protein [Anaerolineae bacterium]